MVFRNSYFFPIFADMKRERPLILISNDDGYRAKGINFLAQIAREFGDVVIVAPDGTRSGYAMSVTFWQPLTARQQRFEEGNEELGSLTVVSCSGTPVDCVKLGLHSFCTRKPSLVLGGINHGDNSSVNAHYSGTVGIMMEGCMKDIPSVAFSLCNHEDDADFEPMRPYINKVMDMVLKEGLPKGVCLNVNAPDTPDLKGLKICSMANGSWGKELVERMNPRGFKYYWMVGQYTCLDERDTSDQRCIEKGYVTVTPLKIDMTAYEYADWLETRLT